MTPAKRVFDFLFSLFVVTLGFPVFFLLFLLIRLSSKGPAIYTCSRIGLHGTAIRCYKFRSMKLNSDRILNALLETNPELKEEWNRTWKLQNDPRITWIGNFLRKTSLDELPQFFNVLKGDLSVVGPRPVTQEEIDRFFGSKKDKILSVRPGITGLWQTSGRNLLTFEERIRLDEHYVDNRTFWLDLKLILKTIPQLISQKGAY